MKKWILPSILAFMVLGIVAVGVNDYIHFQVQQELNRKSTEIKSTSVGLNPDNIFNMVNEYRVANGKPALLKDDRLCVSSKAKANDMVDKNYYSHNSPDGSYFSEFIKPSAKFSYAGENLSVTNESENTVVERWIGSPSHLKNIMDRYTKSCVSVSYKGVYEDKKNTYFVVQHFISE